MTITLPPHDHVDATIERVNTLLQTVLAELAEQASNLTRDQRQRLDDAYIANYQQHRRAQLHICHRIREASPGRWPDQYATRQRIWWIANAPGTHRDSAPCAASDAALVELCGDLMTQDEKRLFDAPWHTVFPLEVTPC